MASPTTGATSATSGSLDQTMQAAIASLEQMMQKQLQFTIDSNPLKAGESMAKSSHVG